MSMFKAYLHRLPNIQPLRGPDPLPPMPKAEPESDLRYRPIALLHGGVAVVDYKDWRILAECREESTAARLCALLESDKSQPPF